MENYQQGGSSVEGWEGRFDKDTRIFIKDLIAKTREEERKISEALWDILDSIDTLPDMLHPNTPEGHEKCWKMMVKRADYNSKLNPQFDYADCEHIMRFVEKVLETTQVPVKNRVWGGMEA